MLKIYTTIMSRLVREEKGASAVEYAVLVGALGLVVATGVTAFGTSLATAFGKIVANAGLK